MTFLLFSVLYPSDDTTQKLQRDAKRYGQTASAFYRALTASARDEQWKYVLRHLRAAVDRRRFCTPQTRPLRPNDDNYNIFVGPQWQPDGSTTKIPSAMAGLLPTGGDSDNEPVPHYDRCACCTRADPSKQCGKCKIVRYCSRDCQAKHWKQVHKQSCFPAVADCSLERALRNNDGFWLSPDDCRLLSDALLQPANVTVDAEDANVDLDGLFPFFGRYFYYVADLGGCFVL